MAKELTDIRVFCIAETKVNQEAVRAWLGDLGADEFVAELDSGAYDDVPDPALLVALAAKQCYMAFQVSLNPNLTRVRKDMVEYLDNILRSKHGSVLEHAVYTFGVNGCSRVFTGEQNRHRAGVAISERSMRFIRYRDIEYWMPPCFRDDPDDSPELRQKKDDSRYVMQEAFKGQERAMARFETIWSEELGASGEGSFHKKKVLTSAFRRVIGMGIATGGVWSLNLRALRHTIAMRTDPSAEEEIIEVYRQIGSHMVNNLGHLFGDFNLHPNGAYVPEFWKV